MAKKVLTSFKGILSEAEARGYVVGNMASSVGSAPRGVARAWSYLPKARSEIPHGEAGRVSNGQAVAAMAVLFATAIDSGFRASEFAACLRMLWI